MPIGEESVSMLLVVVAGRQLPAPLAQRLVRGFVDDSTVAPDQFELEFVDDTGTVVSEGGFSIGKEVELKVQNSRTRTPVTLLKGEVTTVETSISALGKRTVIRGLDLSHRLFHGTSVQTYVDKTASDIAREIAGKYSLSCRTDRTSMLHKHILQDGVSDWEFLVELARVNAFQLSVISNELRFLNRTSASAAPGASSAARQDPLVLEHGVNLLELRATMTADSQAKDVEIRGWDPMAKRAVVARKPARTPSAQVNGHTPSTIARDVKAQDYIVTRSQLTSQGSCDQLAGAVAQHLASGHAELDGTARGNPDLRANQAVTVNGVGEPFHAARFTLTSTRHEFSADGYRTHFLAGTDSDRSLAGVAHAGVRGAGSGLGSGLTGLVPALVTNCKDPEDKARVKVEYPTLGDRTESGWARVLLPGAGMGRGFFVLPEVRDEVLVGFGAGDPNDPYILGGLYNGRDQPQLPGAPYVDGTSGNVTRRAWVSRTGMRVEFTESEGGSKLSLVTADDKQQIVLQEKPQQGITVITEGPVEIKAKQAVTVESATGNVDVNATSGNITVKAAAGHITLKAGGSLDLEAMSIKIKATSSLDLQGATVKVAGQGAAELSASGVTTVRGSLVKIN